MPRDQFVVFLGMAIYYFLFLVGTVVDLSLLNLVGALLFMAFMTVMRFRKLIDPPLDRQGLLLLLFLALAILTTLLNFEDVDPSYLVKLCASVQFFLVFNSLRLRPLHHAPVRKWFIWPPLILVACSLATGQSTQMLGATRAQGLFVNPNNLALIGLCLLFFIDERKDSRPVKLGFHLLTVAIIALSGTSGALVAYFLGLGTRIARACSPRQLAIAGGLLLMLLPLGCRALLGLEPNHATDPNVLERTVNSLVLVRDYLAPALSGEQFNYYQLGKVYGESSTSGLWRLALWTRGLRLLGEAGPARLLLGFGVGSTGTHMDTLMHNDYLRLFFEMGLAGFLTGCLLLGSALKRLPGEKRYCGAIVLCYGFTENIVDNLVFVTLFLLFLAAARAGGESVLRLAPVPARARRALKPSASGLGAPARQEPRGEGRETPGEEPPADRQIDASAAEPRAEGRKPSSAPRNGAARQRKTPAKPQPPPKAKRRTKRKNGR